MEYRVDFEAIPWDSPMKGMRQKVVRHGSKQLRLVEYSRELKPHWCEKGHIGYVLEGEIENTFDSGKIVFGPGVGMFIPPGAEHRHMGQPLSSVVRVVFVEDV